MNAAEKHMLLLVLVLHLLCAHANLEPHEQSARAIRQLTVCTQPESFEHKCSR